MTHLETLSYTYWRASLFLAFGAEADPCTCLNAQRNLLELSRRDDRLGALARSRISQFNSGWRP